MMSGGVSTVTTGAGIITFLLSLLSIGNTTRPECPRVAKHFVFIGFNDAIFNLGF